MLHPPESVIQKTDSPSKEFFLPLLSVHKVTDGLVFLGIKVEA